MSLLCQISHNDKRAAYTLGKAIKKVILQRYSPPSPFIILCIGTDRCPGDSLGPLVGMFLEEYRLLHCHVWGTLEKPVHALNLQETLDKIYELPDPFILSIDACLGLYDHIGDVQVVDGPLKPGVGVKKVLPSVGDFHVKGVVNVHGFLEPMVLQNTRLYTVMSIAKVIANAIIYALR